MPLSNAPVSQIVAPYIVGISGGSAAGKTMVAGLLEEKLALYTPVVIGVDRYFLDKSHLPPDEMEKQNYDIPEALNFERLADDLEILTKGKSVKIPIYDYVTRKALAEKEAIKPSRLIIVEGILLFHPEILKPFLDFTIFVHANREERLRRRIARDIAERGRTKEQVIRQFNETVEPAFEKFIAPTRDKADLILDWNLIDTLAIQKLADRIKALLSGL